MADLYVQRDQPPGVPPLHLTGERTLPDVPEENYWYRRHLRRSTSGSRSACTAAASSTSRAARATAAPCSRRTAASVVGVDANPDAFEHARLKYTGGNLAFERDMIETWTGDVDCVVFLQTIEHVQDPDAVLARLRDLVGPRGVVYVSTPNVLTLAPKGEARSGNPWHVREYRPEEYRALCARHFAQRRPARACSTRASCACTSSRSSTPAGTRSTRGSGSRSAFYDRFTPAISERDFRLRRGALDGALDLLAVLRP